MISATIVTYNEASKLKDCLESIKDLADEIVIVDLGSSDELDEILKLYKHVRKINHERVPYVELVRQFAIDKCKGDWILVLDPDERVSKPLAAELKKISANKSFNYAAVNIPTKNLFWGRWISHTNFWPDRHLRFFRTGKVVWHKKIHSYPKVSGEVYELPAQEKLGLIHYGYDKRLQFITKQHRYAIAEAKNNLEEGKRFSLVQLIWKPVRQFLARYIKHRGYLDGFDGIYLVACLMYYEVMVQFNMIRYAKSYKNY